MRLATENLSGQVLPMSSIKTLIEMDDELLASLEKVAKLDFTMLKVKVCRDENMTMEESEEIEDLYRKFLALNMRYPARKICPTGPIDLFWHAHILDTRAYATDCESLFGHMLHHFPYFGMRGAQDKRACKNFCVNGHPAGNCHIARSDDDRRKESSTQGVVGQPVG